ncbi:MAG: 16S rRNA (guanine(966)-N(2))-methyltransferase RsmD [Anaerolineales bacterium]|nr:16S rRNA (guanine(966)-N(2))-methyltransferase RsmD [Chloroflexota bacterium]MBL6982064.1 16S rRNA (guanine(966)-N(2))-methyltransferase RsmD [Anaerolineales bacterium]
MSNLRVIAGTARGQNLRSVPGDVTRPITDRVKESLFNIIGPDIQDAFFLDMFAGTGAVGIEALSRGAKRVRFIDRHRQAVKTVRTNLSNTKLADRAEVIQMDAFLALDQKADSPFDYVYIAPPQYKGIWKKALVEIDARLDLLAEFAWVIVQIDPLELEKVDLNNLQEFDQRQYGSTLLLFYVLPEIG